MFVIFKSGILDKKYFHFLTSFKNEKGFKTYDAFSIDETEILKWKKSYYLKIGIIANI